MSALLQRYQHAANTFTKAVFYESRLDDTNRGVLFGVIAAHEALNGLGHDLAQALRDEYDTANAGSE